MRIISLKTDSNYLPGCHSRFVSLWDMLQLQAGSFLSALTLLASAVGDLRATQQSVMSAANVTQSMSLNTRAHILKAVEILRDTCEQHGLTTSLAPARRCYALCVELLSSQGPTSPQAVSRLLPALEGLVQTVVDESRNRMFYALDQGAEITQQNADSLFGQAVVDAFPDADFDIGEAGRALSFRLWTASVMHTMRVLEIGLKALARHAGVEWNDNWNRVLNDIEAKLRSVRRADSGAEEEEWAAEAGVHLRFIKNAWRNQSMHSGTRYDERQAREIFTSSRSFMGHLAERIVSDDRNWRP